jgi:hypothetical protein
MREAIQRCRLDLSGLVVFTEAASGAYVVTPVLAALAGAEAVYAVTRPSLHGTVEEVVAQTDELARQAGVRDRIEIVTEKRRDMIARADIVTNSGHVRPIDAGTISWMKPSAVVPLMYEAWEFREGDVDLDACRRRGIRVAGTREDHPAVDICSCYGPMAVKLLFDAGLPVRGCNLLLLCDNPFQSYIRDGLARMGACVESRGGPGEDRGDAGRDAVVVALRPRAGCVIGAHEAEMIAARWPDTVVAQFWGDVDRAALEERGVVYWPKTAPARGHMGVLPSDLGPDPIVRLQAGGLKVGEVLQKGPEAWTPAEAGFISALDGQPQDGTRGART